MKRKYLLTTMFTIAALGCFLPVYTSSDGAPAGSTGAPGENSSACAQNGCHTGNSLNDASGTLTIKVLDNQSEVTTFTAGKTYDVQVDLTRSGAAAMGFQATVKDGNTRVGTLAKGSTNTRMATMSYVTHTSAALQQSGQQTWTFKWTPPTTGSNTVTVYAAGNAANNSGTTLGDFIYKTSKTLTRSTVSLKPETLFSQNLKVYPNPAREHIFIDFTLPEASIITADLFDANGKVIKTITTEKMPSGSHQLQMQTGSLPQGVYLLQLNSGNFKAVKKVIKN